MSMLRSPFRRRSTPSNSPRDTPKTDRSTSMTRSIGSSSVNSLDLNECDSNVYAEIDINTAMSHSTNANNTIAIVDSASADTDTNNDIESTVFDSMPSLNFLNLTELNSSRTNLFHVDDDIEVGEAINLGESVIDELVESSSKSCDLVVENVGCDNVRDSEATATLRKSDSSVEIFDDAGYKILRKKALPYANQEIADNFKMETTSHLYDIDANNEGRSTGAIRKTDNKTNEMDTTNSSQSFSFPTKSVNTLFNTLKDKIKKPTNNKFDIFESSIESDTGPSHMHSEKSSDSPIANNDKFNDTNKKSRLKQKLKFSLKFASTKKSKICQRCLKNQSTTSQKNVLNRAKQTGAHDSTIEKTSMCMCAIDFDDNVSRGNDHYSDLISVSI